MTKQEQIYIPLINEFKENTKDLYEHNLWKNKHKDLSGLFIPHVFENYNNATNKIFYIGQDTYNWIDLKETYSLTAEQYLEKNNNWPKTIKVALNNTDSYYRPYSFWNFVSKLQLAFNNEKYDSLLDLSSTKETVLNQLGWGNIFSLEKLCTIEKYGNVFASTFDKDIYKKLLNASKKISRIKNIMDAFNPNYIIILAWQEVEKWLFGELEYEFNRNESIEELLSVYNIKNSSTKILWTYHPRALCWKKQKPDELIKILIDRK